MKLKLWILVLSFLTVVNLAAVGAFLFVHHSPRMSNDHGFRHPGGRPFFGRDRHGLPERLTTLIHEFRDDTRDLHRRAIELEDEVVERMKEARVDREAVDSLLKELSAVRLEMSRKAAGKMIEAKEFLSPEQQEVFYHAILRGRPGGPPGPRGRRHRP